MSSSSRSRPRPLPITAVALALVAGCHTIRSSEETTRGETRRERRATPPRALPPRVELTDDGRLRFVEPLVCGQNTVSDLEVARVDRRTPNAATLIVGIVATAAGAVALIQGASGDDPGGSPLTYVGPVMIAGGLPLAIGPFTGNRTTRRRLEVKQVRTPGEDERCGERPVAATGATITWSGLRSVGAVDADGVFAVSPFSFVDAFAVADAPPLALAVELTELGGGRRTLEAVIDRTDLARAQAGFLARAGVDATVEPIRKVPRLEPGVLTLRRGGPAGARTIALTVPLDNVGPGPAFAVRLILSSPSPELDGRVVYVGRLAAHAETTVTATLPISDQAFAALATSDATVSARLRDAFDASPTTPIRFAGRIAGP